MQIQEYACNRQVAQRVCPQCDNEIPPESHANKVYCSRRCRQQFHREQNTGQSNPLEHNDTPEQTPQPPVKLYTPTRLFNSLCEIDSEYKELTVNNQKLKELLDARDPAPAPADVILTEEVKGCFQAKPGTCLITAAFEKADNLTHLIPDVISAIKTEGIRSFAWESGGDLVFVVGDEDPEWKAIQVREIMLNIGGCDSIRLSRGSAWGRNDWKSRYFAAERFVPNGWDNRYWTG